MLASGWRRALIIVSNIMLLLQLGQLFFSFSYLCFLGSSVLLRWHVEEDCRGERTGSKCDQKNRCATTNRQCTAPEDGIRSNAREHSLPTMNQRSDSLPERQFCTFNRYSHPLHPHRLQMRCLLFSVRFLSAPDEDSHIDRIGRTDLRQ